MIHFLEFLEFTVFNVVNTGTGVACLYYFSVLFVYGCMCVMPDHTKLHNVNHYDCKNIHDN